MKKKITAIVLAMFCLLINTCLAMSKESKADLDNELAQMVGDTGTKTPKGFNLQTISFYQLNPLGVSI